VVSGKVAAEAGCVPAAPHLNGSDHWLPPGWRPPRRLELPTGHRLRPIRPSDVNLHLRAVLESQERLWARYGPAWQWPPRSLTVDQDREQLRRREADAEQHRSFTYALFDLGETALLGCVDIDPAPGGGTTAAVSWWVVDWLVASPIERALDEIVPAWIATDWPLTPQRGVVTRLIGS